MNDNLNKRLIINNYIIELMERSTENNMGLFELYILNKIHNIPIIILINGISKYYINEKISELKNMENNTKYLTSKNICINYELYSGTNYPYAVDIIYYK